MNKERLDEIIESINKHILVASIFGEMTNYDCVIGELIEYTLDLQEQIDKAIEYVEYAELDNCYYKLDKSEIISILKGKKQ